MISLVSKILRRLSYYLLVLITIFATSCGGAKKEDSADITIVPGEPIVINADAVIGTKSVKAPWFSMRFRVSNRSSEPITIVAFKLKIQGLDENGAFASKESSLVASSEPIVISSTVTCTFNHFGVFNPGEIDQELRPGGASTTDCSTLNDVPRDLLVYFGDAPKGIKGGNNFRYQVRMEVVGWFGTYTLPTSRFNKIVEFRTQ